MAIYLKDVIFEFETHRVIDQITLNVSEQRIGIVGVNGSGKSTLARLISGLIFAISCLPFKIINLGLHFQYKEFLWLIVPAIILVVLYYEL